MKKKQKPIKCAMCKVLIVGKRTGHKMYCGNWQQKLGCSYKARLERNRLWNLAHGKEVRARRKERLLT